MNLSRLLPHIAILAILLVCSSIYYGDIIHELPFGFHEWAQADRYALAINFYDNGMNFFLPATNNLSSIHGIVGVEFPLQSYLAAALGLIFGRDSISVLFRLLDIGIAITGLYFLFRAVYSATADFVVSLVAPLFIFCSPVYVFYSGNYIPDPAGASIVFIAFYYLLKYIRHGRFRSLICSIAIATLAALVKSSTISYLAGILFYGLYRTFIVEKNRRAGLYIILACLLSGAAIAANIRYIQYVNETYHSTLFLTSLNPFKHWDDFIHFLENEYKKSWMHEYLTLAQYPFYFFLLGFGGMAFIRNISIRACLVPLPVFFLSAAYIFYLFSRQFGVHDYYFIAIFLPLTAYCLVIALIAIHHNMQPGSIKELRAGLFSAMLITFFFTDRQIYLRMQMQQDYSANYGSTWLKGGAKLLEELRIPKNELIVVGEQDAPNLGLVYFDRKGNIIQSDVWHKDMNIAYKFLTDQDATIFIIKDDVLKDVLAKDSTALHSFEILARKENKAVLRKK